MTTVLVTGAAGFIGSSLSEKLLQQGYEVIGIDNLTDNYNPLYKKENLSYLYRYQNFKFHKIDILNNTAVNKIFTKYLPHTIIHLAALTGVRASLLEPKIYEEINVLGTKNIYDTAVKFKAKKFIFSSSSSVYGNSKHIPFSELQKLTPKSPYAKTKKEAEILIQKLYSKYHLSTVILRFFSVYGPKGRPDMAPYLFTASAIHQKKIAQYGDGNSARDYTYIDDVTEAIIKLLHKNQFHLEIFNIGNSSPVKLHKLIRTVENLTGFKTKRIILPMNKSESVITFADIQKAYKQFRWLPKTSFISGMKTFINWYKNTRL